MHWIFKEKEQISTEIKSICKELSLKFKDIGPIIRFAISSKLKAPSIDELCFVLGKERTLDRINTFNNFID